MIEVAIVGAGQWGPNLIRNLDEHQDCRVRWVIDRDPVRLLQVKSRFPDVRVDADVEVALTDPVVSAMVVATPTVTHYGLVKRALEHGKHVLVEKPLTADTGQAEELCALAELVDRVLMVGHVFLYNSAVRRAKHHIEAGHLGSVYYISMVRTNLGPIRMDVNAAWDLASHDVAITNYWLDQQAVKVSAVAGTWINDGVEDAVFATLEYPGNVLVNLHASWLNPRKAREMTVVGDHRMLTVDDMDVFEPVRIYNKAVTNELTTPEFIDSFTAFRSHVREGSVIIPRVPLSEPLKLECNHFLECVAQGKGSLTDGAQALSVVRTVAAIERSFRNHGCEEAVV